MHTTFSSALSALNQTGILGPFGAALNGVDQGLQQISQHGKDVGLAMIGVGGAMAGIGVGLSALGSKEQAAHQQLQAAIEATGKSYDDYTGQIDKTVAAQEHYGHSSAETQDALRILTQATHDPTKALQDMSVASDLAAAKHESLTAAAGQLGKAYNGSARLLKQFGVDAVPTAAKATAALATAQGQATSANDGLTRAQNHLNDVQSTGHAKAGQLATAQLAVKEAAAKAQSAHDKLTAAQKTNESITSGQADNIKALGVVLKGQASASADTFSGKLKAMGTHLEDNVAQFGQKYGPAVTAAGTALAGLGAVTSTTTALMEAGRAAALGTRIELMAQSGGAWAPPPPLGHHPTPPWTPTRSAIRSTAIAALVAGIIYLATQTQVFQTSGGSTSSMLRRRPMRRRQPPSPVPTGSRPTGLIKGVLPVRPGLAVTSSPRTPTASGAWPAWSISHPGPAFPAVQPDHRPIPPGGLVSGDRHGWDRPGVAAKIRPDQERPRKTSGGIRTRGRGDHQGLGRGSENAMHAAFNTVWRDLQGRSVRLKGPPSTTTTACSNPRAPPIMGGLLDSISAGSSRPRWPHGHHPPTRSATPSTPSGGMAGGPAVQHRAWRCWPTTWTSDQRP